MSYASRFPESRVLSAMVVLAFVVASLATVDLRPAAAMARRPAPSTTAATVEHCDERSEVVAVEGDQATGYRSQRYDFTGDTTIDARTASWSVPSERGIDAAYPLHLRGETSAGICLVGGQITLPYSHETTSWADWHDTAGVLVKTPGVWIVGTHVHNVGDGYRFARLNSGNWRLQGVRASQVHDDCVENDAMLSGAIDDSFFDGCYVFYSSRGDSPANGDGSDQRMRITNTLVRMESMPFHSHDDAGGHGPIWKMGNGVAYGGPARTGISPQLELRDTIIRVDERPTKGSLGLPQYDGDQDGERESDYVHPDRCSNNTLILAGSATLMPDERESYERTGCFRILEGQEGLDTWDAAVRRWEARRAASPIVEPEPKARGGGDGSRIEDPTPTPRPAPSAPAPTPGAPTPAPPPPDPATEPPAPRWPRPALEHTVPAPSVPVTPPTTPAPPPNDSGDSADDGRAPGSGRYLGQRPQRQADAHGGASVRFGLDV